MKITSMSISDDKSSINLTIIDGTQLTSLLYWTNETYKDFNQSIDLSDYLSNGETQNIIIPLSAVNESSFDGIYFIEAQDPDQTSLAYTSELRSYKECALDRILALNACDSCNQKEDLAVINVNAMIKGLQIALEEGFIGEILLISKALNKYCKDCKTCGQYSNQEKLTSTNDNFETITVSLNGGSLD